jgi:hypothetical protein
MSMCVKNETYKYGWQHITAYILQFALVFDFLGNNSVYANKTYNP